MSQYFAFQWHITDECDQRCKHCYIFSGEGCKEFFWKLMVLLKSKNIPFTLMGNPFHLDDEICRMLKVCGCEKYQMSL